MKSNKNGKDILLISLYVDDLVFMGNNPAIFKELNQAIIREFEMTNNGLTPYFLEIEIMQSKEGIFISLEAYMKEICKRFKMKDYKLVSTPVECVTKLSKHNNRAIVDPIYFKSLIGSLRYLTCSRTNIIWCWAD